MIDCCDQKNPLVRNGTSQKERYSKALDPSYIAIDEKSIEDTIAFAYKYADLIKYYERDNKSRDNWKGFFGLNTTVKLAVISVAAYESIEKDINTLFLNYKRDVSTENEYAIIEAIFNIAIEIHEWNTKFTTADALKVCITSEIEEQLQAALKILITFNKSVPPVKDYKPFYNNGWDLTKSKYDDILPDVISGADQFRDLFSIFYQSYVKIINRAKMLYQQDVQHGMSHQPHITLFITFLYLLTHAKKYLNKLTQRHLDFYYKEVLKLEKKKQVPDLVHVIFKLAENYTSFALKNGTLLNAGKDAEGNPLSYELTDEAVVNKATVDQLKTIFVDKESNYKTHAAVAANSGDGMGGEFVDDLNNWKAFGSNSMPDAKIGLAIASPVLFLKEGKRTITLSIGLDSKIDSSKLLALPAKDIFKIHLSSEESWLDVVNDALDIDLDNSKDYTSMIITISLNSGDPAVTNFNSKILDGGYDTNWPVLKMYLNENATPYAYETLKGVKIKEIEVVVDCEGVRDLILQNDQTLFAPDKAFAPFGPRPLIGKNFYIGSSEVFSKELNNLSVVIDWLDLPASGSFRSYYNIYNTVLGTTIDNGSFTTRVSYLQDKQWTNLFSGEDPLLFKSVAKHYMPHYTHLKQYITDIASFSEYGGGAIQQNISGGDTGYTGFGDLHTEMSDGDSNKSKTSAPDWMSEKEHEEDSSSSTHSLGEAPGPMGAKPTHKGSALKENLTNISEITMSSSKLGLFKRCEGMLDITKYDSSTMRGFLQLQLSGSDFLHNKYSEVYTKQALALTTYSDTIWSNKSGTWEEIDNPKPPPDFPNEPYTPTIKSVYLNYSSSTTIDFTKKKLSGIKTDQVFHLYPFGHREIFPELLGNDVFLMPQFKAGKSPCVGNLYIGLKDAKPSQNVSLLFQVYEGSGNPEKIVPEIGWLYLCNNEWKPFEKSDVVLDTTMGLVKSGIMKFILPSDITDGNTLLDGSCLWIKACVSEDIDALPDLVDIQAQAAFATFKDNNNSLTHLESVLPADIIAKLSQRTAAIKGVSQPYASFGGKTEESDSNFYRRISERLRHKNRAITIWDYERLVLEEFPSIHKVKCINHADMDIEIAPGHVMVVVIPDLRNKNAVHPLEPKVDVGTLSDIAHYLVKRNALFIKGNQPGISDYIKNKLIVLNPIYEYVQVDATVKVKADDPEYYKKVLNDDIKKFLAPWAYDEGADIGFGSTLHKSTLINFIENREYIDFITNINLNHFTKDGLGNLKSQDYTGEIKAITARSVLTSFVETNGSSGLEHIISVDPGCH